ncbi:28S ribosomal protein S29, mitochondrial, partial [Lates japonicus]
MTISEIFASEHLMNWTSDHGASQTVLQTTANDFAGKACKDPSYQWITQESDPACHSEKHIGQFYTVPPAHIRNVFPCGLPRRYIQQMKTFNEACLMVRQPALEVISYLKKTDFNKPALRYVFYGMRGTGKSLSFCHTVHFCYTQGWLVLHIPDALRWVKDCTGLLPSSYNTSRFDQPLQAVEWLRNFRTTNEQFLSKIKIKQRYVWTKREFTEEGSLLGELVDQGISRVKSSSDVVGALMKELRLQSGQPESNFSLAVAVNSVNALWGKSNIMIEDRRTVRKHIHNPVMPHTRLLLFSFRRQEVLCVPCLTIIRRVFDAMNQLSLEKCYHPTT